MRLSSSLEPNGAKSTKHYLVLHHENKRDLIILPKTYQDLQKEVETLYHIKPYEFYVESKELNICAGEKVQIPGELWDDIAGLLGNVYVVPRLVDAHPESAPEPLSSPSQPEARTTQGVIKLEEPLAQNQIVVINLGDTDIEVDLSSEIKLDIQIVDEKQDCALRIDLSSQTGSILSNTATNISTVTLCRSIKDAFPLTTNHTIIIRKVEFTFLVLLDYLLVGAITPPTNRLLATVRYDFGTDSPFKGFFSANVYGGFGDFKAQPRLRDVILDKDALYRQIINCDPSETSHILAELSAVRREVNSFKVSNSGIRWRSQRLLYNNFASLDWDVQPHSLYVLRFTLQSSGTVSYIRFGRSKAFHNYSLHIMILPDNKVVFSEGNGSDSYHKITLVNPIQTTGKHAIAFVNHAGQMRVIFDFKEATVLPRTTMLSQTKKPTEVHTEICHGVEADVYDFR